MTRIPKMVEMTLLDLRPLSRDLRLSPNLPSSRITTVLANPNPRETNPGSRLKKRKCHLPTANNSSNSSRTRAVYGDSLGWEGNLTTQLSRISKTSHLLVARWYPVSQLKRGDPHHSYKDRKLGR